MWKMEPVATAVDKLKAFAKSTQDFANGLFNWSDKSKRRNPIEILKRLQREAFMDIMKLRDRQEKFEKMLMYYRSSKGNPFQEAGTNVWGKVDVLGAIFFMDGVDEHKSDVIQRSGIRTGIDARIAFQTIVREKDTMRAEFLASERGQTDALASSLLLSKVSYAARVSDWFSAVAIPVGAQCRDVEVATSSCPERGLTDYSEFGPPFLNNVKGSAIGITVRKSNVVASLAQFVSSLGTQTNLPRSLSTFGQCVWQISDGTMLSVLGVRTESRAPNLSISFGALSFPGRIFNRSISSEMSAEEDSPTSREGRILEGSIALMFNSKLDESTRIGGWIETKNSIPRSQKWAVSMCDTPEDEFGWGLTVGGSLQDSKSWNHFQIETFLNLNVGKGVKLQPAFLYVKEGPIQFPALMLRSSWSI